MEVNDIMDSHNEDRLVFERQRRNVMISCLVVLTVYILGIKYEAITVFGLNAAAPQNFDIAWASLIWYFVWRLSQCEKPYKVISKPAGYYRAYISTKLPTNEELIEYGAQAFNKVKANPLANTTVVNDEGNPEPWHPIEATFTDLAQLQINREYTTYRLVFNVTVTQTATQVVVFERQLPHTTALARWAWARSYFVAGWKDQYFSEYLLPYWLGFICVFYCCNHHVVNHVWMGF